MNASKSKPKKSRSKCPIKTCPGNYNLSFEAGYPVFVCDVCGRKDETWKKFYTEYLHLYKVQENWSVEKNKISCIIGLFCHLYRDRYQTDYIFIPKNPNPFSAKECKDCWTLLATFKNDIVEVRKYLMWAFKHIIGANIKITSMAYLNNANIIRKYMLSVERRNIMLRTSDLPKDLTEWCKQNNINYNFELETMNDLGALLNHVIQYGSELKEDSAEKIIVGRAKQIGLIKDNKLNIGKS